MIWILLLLLMLVVSLIGFRLLSDPEKGRVFLFIPAEVMRGKNLPGVAVSQFSHSDWSHLLFNGMSFFFFAPMLERLAGPVFFSGIVIASAIGSILLVLLLKRNQPEYRCLGSSGIVTGIIFAAIVYHPGISIFLFFLPIPIPGPIFALLFIAASFFLARRGGGLISHEAHLGGAAGGFLSGWLFHPQGLQPFWQALKSMAG